jgi:hypothetical protein
MSISTHERLKALAFESWIGRGRPVGSPDVDWEEALKQLADTQSDQEPVPAPGSTPSDLGAELLPETSHDQS